MINCINLKVEEVEFKVGIIRVLLVEEGNILIIFILLKWNFLV